MLAFLELLLSDIRIKANRIESNSRKAAAVE